MTAELLRVEGLHLRFGGVKAISDVSFNVEEGALTALIGPNGAGKTSMFNCLSGHYRPTSGTIWLNGRSIAGLKRHQIARLGVARSFQTPSLFPGLSVRGNLMAAMHAQARSTIVESMLGLPRMRSEERWMRRKADDLLTRFGLESLADEEVDSLAYGVRKHVEVARAVAQEPRLLLLDEPMAGMTAHEKQVMSEHIATVRREFGLTVLLVEHDMRVVMSIADRVVVLNFGQKIADATPTEVQSDAGVIAAYLGDDATTAS